MQEQNSIIVAPFPPLTHQLEFIAPASADKSLTHRAVMLASMASGVSEIVNPLDGDDCSATRSVFQNLCVEISENQTQDGKKSWTVHSPGMDRWRSPMVEQDLGNSGTSARLLTGLFAGVPGLTVTLTGDESLRSRPMTRVVEPLRNMVAKISGPNDGATLKLTITGTSIKFTTHYLGTPSAQIKSALLLAGISADGETLIDIPSGGRDHTEIMLNALGAMIRRTWRFGRELISIVGPWRPKNFHCEIPTDPSSVAFFGALAALHPGMQCRAHRVLQNPTRIGFFKVLSRMGVEVVWSDVDKSHKYLGETVANLMVYRAADRHLKAINIHQDDIAAMIDEIPALAVLCSFAEGTSMISGLAELRVKESDRLSAIEALLKAAGIDVRVEEDSLVIAGQTSASAFNFSSQDHRMVMSAMILATRAAAPSTISGLSWIRTSFPLFLEAFQNIKSRIL